MIECSVKGDFKKTFSFLERIKGLVKLSDLDKYGRQGVKALSSNSPRDTGLMSESWYYKIERGKHTAKIIWANSDIENGTNVAVLIQYGHATKNGSWVKGIDYINPALKPIFEKIGEEVYQEVANNE